jgi:hypothetical protein
MNGRIKKILFLSCLLASSKGLGCPTCVGRFEKDTPVFFSDEFYRSSTEKIGQANQDDTKENQDGDDEE